MSAVVDYELCGHGHILYNHEKRLHRNQCLEKSEFCLSIKKDVSYLLTSICCFIILNQYIKHKTNAMKYL